MSHENNLIRTMVRGAYDLQKIRIQMGNRVTTNFKSKLGMAQNGMSEKELAKQEKKILDQLRASYKRITDGVVSESGAVEGKLPSAKKFKGDEIISSYTELVLVDQYMTLLRDEEQHFRRLENVLKGIPIYDEFLTTVRGVGPAMAGIIISEIDITRSEYPSSLWKYAGLDVIIVGRYTDDKGKVHSVPASEVDAFYADGDYDKKFLAEGKYEVTYESHGRSRKEEALVLRQYTNRKGEEAWRKSITYNPFLKTKLIGVLGTSFLRAGVSRVDGKKMGAAKRMELAISEGFDADAYEDDEVDTRAAEHLVANGHEVLIDRGHYAEIYYGYRNRLDNDPHHTDKTDGHKHNMAIRYMVKRFLVDLYNKWRALEGLVVAEEYGVAKLGLVHHVAVPAKARKAG